MNEKFEYQEITLEYLNHLRRDDARHEAVGITEVSGDGTVRVLAKVYFAGAGREECGGRGFFDTMPAPGEYVEDAHPSNTLDIIDLLKTKFSSGHIYISEVKSWLDILARAIVGSITEADKEAIERVRQGELMTLKESRKSDDSKDPLSLMDLIAELRTTAHGFDERDIIASWFDAIEAKIKAIDGDVSRAVDAAEKYISKHESLFGDGARRITMKNLDIIRGAHFGELKQDDYSEIDDILLPTYTLHETIEAAEKAQGYRIHQDYDWIAIIADAADGELSIGQRKLIQEVYDYYIPF
jgi:hypothetical protein